MHVRPASRFAGWNFVTELAVSDVVDDEKHTFSLVLAKAGDILLMSYVGRE
jgi:nitric oxide synthase oxygenase domain/subunit